MKKKIYEIDNTNFLTLKSFETAYKVRQGKAYLFLVVKSPGDLTGGRPSARYEVAQYSEGMLCPGFSGTEKYDFILSGAMSCKIEAVDYSRTDDAAEAEDLLEMVAWARKNQDTVILDYETNLAWENLRSVKRQKLADKIFAHSLESLASVLRENENEEDLYNQEDCAVAKVFKMVAGHTFGKSGGKLIRSNTGKEYEPDKNGLQQLAKDTDTRIREVLLQGKWYKEDNGHLIGFYNPRHAIEPFEVASAEETHSLIPVALIRNPANTRYTVYIPDRGESFALTKENAPQIFLLAFMVYKKLPEEKMNIRKICQFIFSDIRRDIGRFILIGLLCTLIGLITPLITKYFIDAIIPIAAKNTAVQICVLVLVCNVSGLIGLIAKYFANLRMETKADTDLEAAVMDRLLKLPVTFFKKYSSGDLAARAGAIPLMRKKLFNIVLSCFMNFIFGLVFMLQAYHFCPYFTKWGIVISFIPLLVSGLTSLATFNLEKARVECKGRIQGMLLQLISGIEKIANTNSEKRAFSQWSKEYITQSRISLRLGMLETATTTINRVYPAFISIVFYFLYGKAETGGQLQGFTTGSFLAFLCAYASFQGAFLGIAGSLLELRDLVPLSKRIRPIIKETPEVEEARAPIEGLTGKIEISHLNFRYAPEAPLVLRDVSIKIAPGQCVAIVGNSGAGKSTLLRALLGFEHPESGSIFYDDKDINTIDITSLRRQMGVVLQNDTVMQGTILQNIVGSSGLGEEDAWKAARKVSFDKDIEELPMGMYTMLQAGGGTLSGGQLQRLIIARAIIKNPKVLIFDEATSALDNLTQQTVRKSLDELRVTRIIIAHRLSTIVNADMIYVMKDGEVIESGTYNFLMKKDGYFAELAKRQL